jgi:hypothetical protein
MSQMSFLDVDAFSANDLVYKWDKGQNASVGMGDLSHPDFRVSGHMLKTQAQTFASGTSGYI